MCMLIVIYVNVYADEQLVNMSVHVKVTMPLLLFMCTFVAALLLNYFKSFVHWFPTYMVVVMTVSIVERQHLMYDKFVFAPQ